MINSAEKRFVELADRFLSGQDRSIALANQIEGLLIEEFDGTDLFEELIEPLALYHPGADAPYVNEEQLAADLRYSMRHIVTDER